MSTSRVQDVCKNNPTSQHCDNKKHSLPHLLDPLTNECVDITNGFKIDTIQKKNICRDIPPGIQKPNYDFMIRMNHLYSDLMSIIEFDSIKNKKGGLLPVSSSIQDPKVYGHIRSFLS